MNERIREFADKGIKPPLLYYLFGGKRINGKRYGMYKITEDYYEIYYDNDEE